MSGKAPEATGEDAEPEGERSRDVRRVKFGLGPRLHLPAAAASALAASALVALSSGRRASVCRGACRPARGGGRGARGRRRCARFGCPLRRDDDVGRACLALQRGDEPLDRGVGRRRDERAIAAGSGARDIGSCEVQAESAGEAAGAAGQWVVETKGEVRSADRGGLPSDAIALDPQALEPPSGDGFGEGQAQSRGHLGRQHAARRVGSSGEGGAGGSRDGVDGRDRRKGRQQDGTDAGATPSAQRPAQRPH